MKAWMSSNFNQMPPPTPEVSALARLKICCEHSSVYIFDWIFFIFSGNEDNQRVLFSLPHYNTIYWVHRETLCYK